MDILFVNGPTVCVTCMWAGVDSAWGQEKLEARKMLENGAESHTSGARFVGWRFLRTDCPIFSSDFYYSSIELKTFSILLSGTIQISVINM